MMTFKEDNRPKRNGWAKGEYTNKCRDCGERYIGDKRSWQCADCAYETPIKKTKYIPTAYYGCSNSYCTEQISHLPKDLFWCERFGKWFCGECWSNETLGEMGISLEEYMNSQNYEFD
jgi:hypothetical protein